MSSGFGSLFIAAALVLFAFRRRRSLKLASVGVLGVALAFAGCSSPEDSPGSGGTTAAGATGGSGGSSAGTTGAGGTAGSNGGGTSGGSGGRAGAGGSAGSSGGTTGGSVGSSGEAGGPTEGDLPLIVSFTAAPGTLPDGGGTTSLSYVVEDADEVSIDEGVGVVSGGMVDVNVTETTIFTLTATNANGSVTASTAVVIGQNPSRDGGRFVVMVSPTDGESFIAPATLRLIGIGHDPNVYTNEPVDGRGTNAASVEFFVDDDPVLEVDGANAEYHVFKGFVDGIAEGEHRVWARAVYVDPDLVLDSEPMLITVEAAPTYAEVVDLDQDLVLAGGESYVLEGAADARIRLNGNGHRLLGDAASSLTLRFVDVFDLGSRDDRTEPGVDLTLDGALTLEDSRFDTSNTVSITLQGDATASVVRNLLRSNMSMDIGQFPDGFGDTGTSYPALYFTGGSTGAKQFAGNNVGAGWVHFDRASDWLVGGDTDADENVLIGPRVGIHVTESSAVEVRRNYSHHVYYGGWSQGNDFELQGSPSITVEHNVVFGSSWPVRGVGCEFRYNLVLEAGHQWLWVASGASIHHNVFLGGDADVGGVYVLYDPTDVRIFNNTIDGLDGDSVTTGILMENGMVELHSNAFVRVPRSPVVTVNGGTLDSDYNAFFDPALPIYSDDRMPPNDVTLAGPGFAELPTTELDLDESAIWRRETTAMSVLARYRERYTPAAMSPLTDAGDPALGDGNDIGAVGSGIDHPDDRFGRP